MWSSTPRCMLNRVSFPPVQVGSFGAFLLSRNVQTMSLAPRDGHEAQVQFALERGLPAMLGVLAKNRLPYPARAFDMAHCSRCLIPWSSDSKSGMMGGRGVRGRPDKGCRLRIKIRRQRGASTCNCNILTENLLCPYAIHSLQYPMCGDFSHPAQEWMS